jgi:hypothetical protein
MIRLIAALLALAACGCAADDPYRTSDLWQPTGANAGNLAAMAARPRDLVLGHGRASGGNRLEADAVERLWEGRARPLTSATGSSAAGGVSAGRGPN